MSARDFIYYEDQQSETTGQRFRAILIPAGDGNIPNADGVRPAWGSEPAEDSAWRRMPSGCVQFAEPGEAGFSSLLVGVAGTATMKISIRYDRTGGLDGLTNVIKDYQKATSYAGLNLTFSVTSLNTWIILTDNGDQSRPMDEFVCVFEGCQRPISDKPFRIIPRIAADQEYELFHTGRAVMDAVRMSMVCNDLAAESGKKFKWLFDLLWPDSAGKLTGSAVREILGSANLYSLYSLYDRMVIHLRVCYDTFLRGYQDSGTRHFQFHRGDDLTDGNSGHPYTHIDFYPPDFTRNLGLPSGDPLAYTHTYFIGTVTLDKDGTAVGGLLISQKDDVDTLNVDVSLYDVLSRQASGSFCKVWLVQDSEDQIIMTFNGVLEGRNDPVDLGLAEIIYDEHDTQGGIPGIESAEIIASATASIRSTGGDDRTQGEWKNAGLTSETTAQAEIEFHNMPTMGDSVEDWNYFRDTNDMFPQVVHGIFRRTYNPWALYCIGRPFSAKVDIATRVNHICRIRYDDTHSDLTVHTTPLVLPDIKHLQTDADRAQLPLYVNKVRAVVDVIQREGGLLNWIPMAYGKWFGQPAQTSYSVKVPREMIGYNQLGESYNLAPADEDGRHTAQALSGEPSVDLRWLLGGCFIQKVKPIWNSTRTIPECEVTLFAIRN